VNSAGPGLAVACGIFHGPGIRFSVKKNLLDARAAGRGHDCLRREPACRIVRAFGKPSEPDMERKYFVWI
jgi:hypothetical protein